MYSCAYKIRLQRVYIFWKYLWNCYALIAIECSMWCSYAIQTITKEEWNFGPKLIFAIYWISPPQYTPPWVFIDLSSFNHKWRVSVVECHHAHNGYPSYSPFLGASHTKRPKLQRFFKDAQTSILAAFSCYSLND